MNSKTNNKIGNGLLERLLYQSDTIAVGVFRCHPWYSRFEEAGEIREGHLIVFPRTSVIIHQEGHQPLVADPTNAVFYNQRQPYRREKVSERGDICDYFAFSPQTILAALEHLNPAGLENAYEKPFSQNHAPVDARTYLLQRKVVEHLLSNDTPDTVYVQELGLNILERTLTQVYRRSVPARDSRRAATCREHRELAQATKSLLNQRFPENLGIEDLADELFVSPYHLCRVFRRETGTTIHQYLQELRLRTALENLIPNGNDLTSLALDLGFSSHSHFTRAVRKTYGEPPSQLRQRLQKI